MPPALHSREDVIARLMDVFRHHGYDGASLAELSKATGLGKSSLYHHFPEGKDDMVRAVLDHLAHMLHDAVFAPLRAAGPPAKRIDGMIAALDAFYEHGHESCVLAQLVLGSTHSRFKSELKSIFTEWTRALATVVEDAGIPRAVAKHRAEDAVLRVEGALVLAAGLDDAGVFTRVLGSLATTLLAPVPKAAKQTRR